MSDQQPVVGSIQSFGKPWEGETVINPKAIWDRLDVISKRMAEIERGASASQHPDTVRLDWLERHMFGDGRGSGPLNAALTAGADLRRAIDAAMRRTEGTVVTTRELAPSRGEGEPLRLCDVTRRGDRVAGLREVPAVTQERLDTPEPDPQGEETDRQRHEEELRP